MHVLVPPAHCSDLDDHLIGQSGRPPSAISRRSGGRAFRVPLRLAKQVVQHSHSRGLLRRMSNLDELKNLPGLALVGGVFYLAHRLWRRQAISCAAQWAAQRGLTVASWSDATFEMHRQHPCLIFVASTERVALLDVKLRLRIPLFGGWQVEEVAYCLPRVVAEGASGPLPF